MATAARSSLPWRSLGSVQAKWLICRSSRRSVATSRTAKNSLRAQRDLSYSQRQPRNHVLQYRSASIYAYARDTFRAEVLKARIQNPVLLPILTVATMASLLLLACVSYSQYSKFRPRSGAYPPPVEERLRLALHFTHVQPDGPKAIRYFQEALSIAAGHGMDPFSNEAMGLRIRYAQMLEDFGRGLQAAEIVKSIVNDYEEELFEVDRQLLSYSTAPATRPQGVSNSGTSRSSEYSRSNLVKGLIQAQVKLASLYASDHIQNPRLAKESLSEAINLLVRETKDASSKGLSEDNNAALTYEEIAAIFSQMGDLYATTGEESNAVQTYMLALEPLRKACGGTRSCREVQIFSNIASTMDIAMKKPGATINGQPVTPANLAKARQAATAWVNQAVATVDKVPLTDRDEICETSLLSAQMTRADLLLESGNKEGSKIILESLLPRLREKGLTPLVKMAESGLRRAGT